MSAHRKKNCRAADGGVQKPGKTLHPLGHTYCFSHALVNIRFTSSLTPEDENVIAPAILKAMTAILDLFPVAYALRIDTSDGEVFHHAGSDNSQVMPSSVRSDRKSVV